MLFKTHIFAYMKVLNIVKDITKTKASITVEVDRKIIGIKLGTKIKTFEATNRILGIWSFYEKVLNKNVYSYELVDGTLNGTLNLFLDNAAKLLPKTDETQN